MGYCGKCKERWTGSRKAHCTGCCRTFKSVSAFDRHRRDMKCLNPEDCGMTMKDGVWANWMTEAEIEERYGKK